ncbi:MAG: SPOR domain-containing protein [bacterium]
MRDMERIKPKYNITLDNKQILMLVVSSIVILVLVFIIGFVLGKNAGIKESGVASTGTQVEKPQNAVVFTQQTLQTAEQNAGQVSQTTESAQTVTTGEAEEGKAISATTATKHTELTFYKSLTESKTHHEINKKQTKKTAGKIKEHTTRGPFSIQCGAFKDKAQAERLSKELKEKYKLVSWIESVVEHGNRLYRVKIGHFETKQKAQDYEKEHMIPKGLRNCIVSVNK